MLMLLCIGKTVALSKTNWSPRSIALHDSLDLLGHFTCCYHVESSHHEKKKCQQFLIYMYNHSNGSNVNFAPTTHVVLMRP